MKKLLRPELWLALFPFAATLGTIGYWDRTTPLVLGLPFNLFWVGLWAVLITGFLWVIEVRRRKR